MPQPAAFQTAAHLWPLVEARARKTPQALFACAADGTGALSFGRLHKLALRRAAGLARLGVGAGTVVSWQLPTSPDALVLACALARLGAVQNPLLPMLRAREIAFIARQARTRHLFVQREFRGFNHAHMAEGLAAEIGFAAHCVGGADGWPQAAADALPPFVAPPAAAADAPVRWLFYSSGTTAAPKGVLHADPAVALAGAAMVAGFCTGAGDRHAFVFPATHIGGMNWLFAGLLSGFAHICCETFAPAKTIPQLARRGATLLGAGTVFHQGYLEAERAAAAGEGPARALPAARCFPGGGAPKPPALCEELRALTGAPVVSGYGLTEYPIATLGALGDAPARLANSEGRATPDTEIKIVQGEIRLRGPHLFRGYADESLNAAAFDADGFLCTGDLGELDSAGYLTVTGRLKDVIIRKGENISAAELEAHLHAHPQIAEAAVVGLPDAARGELACAVVVMDSAAGGGELTLAALAAFLEARGLAKQKFPERLELVSALPRGPAGKIQKRELQQRFTPAPADAAARTNNPHP